MRERETDARTEGENGRGRKRPAGSHDVRESPANAPMVGGRLNVGAELGVAFRPASAISASARDAAADDVIPPRRTIACTYYWCRTVGVQVHRDAFFSLATSGCRAPGAAINRGTRDSSLTIKRRRNLLLTG